MIFLLLWLLPAIHSKPSPAHELLDRQWTLDFARSSVDDGVGVPSGIAESTRFDSRGNDPLRHAGDVFSQSETHRPAEDGGRNLSWLRDHRVRAEAGLAQIESASHLSDFLSASGLRNARPVCTAKKKAGEQAEHEPSETYRGAAIPKFHLNTSVIARGMLTQPTQNGKPGTGTWRA